MDKQILLITSTNIYLKSGGGMANRAFFESLKNKYGKRLRVLQYDEHGFVNRESMFLHLPPNNRLNIISELLKGHIHRLTPWIKAYLGREHDHIECCIINSGLFGDVIPILHNYGIKVITIHHNYEVKFQMDNRRPTTFWGLTSYFVAKNERIAYSQSDANIFLSKDDEQAMLRYYGDISRHNNHVVGVYDPEDVDYKIPPKLSTDMVKIAICGSLDCLQSEKGILDFSRNYYQIVKNMLGSSFQITLAGRNPTEKISKFADNETSIRLYANPEDMTETIKDCNIYLCPTNVGSGIKLRIIDGLKLGMPILTHRVSAQGYDYFSSEPWFQTYSNAEEFKEGFCKILECLKGNPNLNSVVYQKYKSYFSHTAGNRRFVEAIKTVLHEDNI